MSEVLEFYRQQAYQSRSQTPWFAKLQEQALTELKHQGFPTRHHEEWKYTLLDTFLQERFQNTSKAAFEKRGNQVPGCVNIWIRADEILGLESLIAELPAGVIIQPLVSAMIEHEEKVKSSFNRILSSEHAFHQLNLALLQNGLFIFIPKEIELEQPIAINYEGQAGQASYIRNLIIAEEGSSAIFVENYDSSSNASYFTNSITEINAEKKAKITHFKVQRENRSSFHMSHVAVLQKEQSCFSSHSLSLGGKLVRSDITAYLKEANAQCLLNGIYAPAQGQHVDHHTSIYHEVPDCQSAQDYKGILQGKSRAVFNGKVYVAKDAQKTHAQQQNKNLLLSADAEIDTKPQLEIFADDVICSHGATVGQLDENALFYFASRGIDSIEASRFLIHAFAVENLQRIEQKELANWITFLLNQQIG